MKRRTLLASAVGAVSLAGCVADRQTADESPAPVRRTAASGRRPVEWTREYGVEGGAATYTENGSPGLRMRAVVRRPSGGFAFTGRGRRGAYVLATDRNGATDWIHRFESDAIVAEDPYGSPYPTRSRGIALTGDGGYVVAGSQPVPQDSSLEEEVDDVGWLAAIDGDRELAWHAGPDTETKSGCRDVVRTVDGNFAFAGWQVEDDGARGWVGVVDGGGDLRADATYDTGTDDPAGIHEQFVALTATSDGGFVLVGKYASGGWVVKTDAEGNEAWRTLLEAPHGVLNDVVETSDGSYLVTGVVRTDAPAPDYTVTDSGGQADLSLALLDESGDVRWRKRYDGGGNEFGRAVVVTENGDFLAVGERLRNRDSGLFVLRTDPEGEPAWSDTYLSAKGVQARDVTQATDGGFVVATSTTVVKLAAGGGETGSPATASADGSPGTSTASSPGSSATATESTSETTTDPPPATETPTVRRTPTDSSSATETPTVRRTPTDSSSATETPTDRRTPTPGSDP